MYYVDSFAEYRWKFCFSMYSHLTIKISVASEREEKEKKIQTCTVF